MPAESPLLTNNVRTLSGIKEYEDIHTVGLLPLLCQYTVNQLCPILLFQFSPSQELGTLANPCSMLLIWISETLNQIFVLFATSVSSKIKPSMRKMWGQY